MTPTPAPAERIELSKEGLDAAYAAQQKALSGCSESGCQRDHLEEGIRAYLAAALTRVPDGIEGLVDRLMAASYRPSDSKTVRAALLQDIAALTQRAERAERALTSAGWTYTEGAAEWCPPLGPSASPLLDEIDRLRAALAQPRPVVPEELWRDALIQARGALMLDTMVDEQGKPYGTTGVALDAIDAALEASPNPPTDRDPVSMGAPVAWQPRRPAYQRAKFPKASEWVYAIYPTEKEALTCNSVEDIEPSQARPLYAAPVSMGALHEGSGPPVEIDYTNHRGERAVRTIIPTGRMVRGPNEFHPDAPWLIEAIDPEKGLRTFDPAKIHRWGALHEGEKGVGFDLETFETFDALVRQAIADRRIGLNEAEKLGAVARFLRSCAASAQAVAGSTVPAREYALEEALRLILPLAKGYAHAHRAGDNQGKVAEAERLLSPDWDTVEPAQAVAGTEAREARLEAALRECLGAIDRWHVDPEAGLPSKSWHWWAEARAALASPPGRTEGGTP